MTIYSHISVWTDRAHKLQILVTAINVSNVWIVLMSNVTIQERKYNLKKANIHTDKSK